MNNGCICCTVRGDLVRIIDGLMRRKGKFDAIIVETTGLADPAPVAQTFFMDEQVGAKTKLDAVVTVADAKWLKDRLKDAPEAKNQIAFADVILHQQDRSGVAGRTRRNRGAHPRHQSLCRLHRTERAKIDIAEVLGRNAFDLDRILDIEPEFLEADEHDHDHDHDHTIMAIIMATTIIIITASSTITTRTCKGCRSRPTSSSTPTSFSPGCRISSPRTGRTFCAPRASRRSRTIPSAQQASPPATPVDTATSQPAEATPAPVQTPAATDAAVPAPDATSAPVSKPVRASATQPVRHLAKQVAAQTAPPVAAPAAVPVQQPAAQPQAAAPTPAPDAAAMKQVRHRMNQFAARANPIRSSLDTLTRQQAASGLNLRGDIAGARQQMETSMDEAEANIRDGNLADARESLDHAERQIEILEKFLGR